ncbi:hypothetical protein [Tessaracoccus coleopterorum]|nr:hypothetical protein [Tessaracoccus coleopterorum]
MTEETRRPTTVSIARTGRLGYTATNARGGTIDVGSGSPTTSLPSS